MKQKFFLCSPILALKEGIKLRKEHFGGIVFDTAQGTMIEVDREAFVMLSIIQNAEAVRKEELYRSLKEAGISSNEASDVILKLLKLGVLVDSSEQVISKKKSLVKPSYTPINWPKGPQLTAPETVHWAITYHCNSLCPDCYSTRYSQNFSKELDTIEAFQVIDILSKWGVLQLAIGGGEPLLRPDIVKITNYAHQKGMIVHITTGLKNIENKLLKKLSRHITCLQLGIKHNTLLSELKNELNTLLQLVNAAKNVGIHIGANLMISNTSINNFETLLDYLTQAGLSTITLLRYKPPSDIARWNRENPSRAALIEFENVVVQSMDKYPNITFRTDCALSFLQRDLAPQTALVSGIRGCTAADRILALAPDGSVFPCSQLVRPDLKCGNILKEPIRKLWAENKLITKYRFYKEQQSFKQGHCGSCQAKDQCGGCRIFAQDSLCSDPGCPKADLAPL